MLSTCVKTIKVQGVVTTIYYNQQQKNHPVETGNKSFLAIRIL